MQFRVLPGLRCQKCINSKLRTFVLGRRQGPFIIIEDDDGILYQQWPAQRSVGIDVCAVMTSVDIDEVKTASCDREPT